MDQNYLRADTIKAANARLINAQAELELARLWGGGLVASGDGAPVPEMAIADPVHLADLLWTMHSTKAQPEATYPEGLFDG